MDAERAQWIMVDVETSGPRYDTHSLLEIGAALGTRSDGVAEHFSTLIQPVSPHVEQSRRTFAEARERGLEPTEAMARFAEWAKPHLARGAVFIARPAAFDWPWIVHYSWRFLGSNPFGFKALCASSWFEARGKRFHVKLPHVAAEDARIQLEHFFQEGFDVGGR